MKKRPVYPFTAIVGQTDMKRALLLNLVNPNLSGVLIRGEKGTAKSTAVRALADLMPLRLQIDSCVFNCLSESPDLWCEDCRRGSNAVEKVRQMPMRVVDLPVNATEDRVVGAIDIEAAIQTGKKCFDAGILAAANNNILYVDEINLLEDHLVDLLLDSAAMGMNIVEREGISIVHPARFVLIGTMNPEEGELRPQLLDRLGLTVGVVADPDLNNRIEVVKRRLAYEKDPENFCAQYAEMQENLKNQVIEAKERLKTITYSDAALEAIAKIALRFHVDGHRADIMMLKTAMTNAAFEGRQCVDSEDLAYAAGFCLPHRMRKNPFEEMNFSMDAVHSILEACEIP